MEERVVRREERSRAREKDRSERDSNRRSRSRAGQDISDVSFTEIPFDELQFIDKIGHGGFGEVWRGLWHNTPVAIKKLLNQGLKKNAIHQMREEVALHEKLRFPFIVQLLGACTNEHYCVVMEIAPHGNLFTLLYNSRTDLPLPLRTGMLFDVGRGMDYLHSCDVLHRDLKSLNLVLFNSMTLKICDFGLSRIKNNAALMSNQRVGTAAWMAPEILRDTQGEKKEFTTKCDVYSFAMIMYEVLARAIPFEGKDDVQITKFVTTGHRPEFPDDALYVEELKELMENCSNLKPHKRPDFSRICQELGEIMDMLGGDPRTQQGMLLNQNQQSQAHGQQKANEEAKGTNKLIKEQLIEREQKVAEREKWIEVELKKLKTEKMNAWIEAELKAHAEKLDDDQVEEQLENDKRAILQFYRDALPPDSDQVGKWDESRDISTWDGVLIENDRIIELDLSENQLIGSIVDFNGALSKLRVLNCHKNRLSGPIPETICSLTSLEYLSLRNNCLSGRIPSGISKLQNLRELYLYQNQISGSLPPSIGNLHEIINLYIYKNKISGQIPEAIGNLSNLLIFSGWGNQFTGSIPPSIGNLTNLLRLELQGNRLEGKIPQEISSLRNLQYLYLHENNLTGPIPPNIQGLMALKFLNLSSNHFTGPIPRSIGNLTSIVRIDFDNNNLTGKIPDSFSNLTQLHDLWLSNNRLTGEIPLHFGNLTGLHNLCLHRNLFSNIQQANTEFKEKLLRTSIQL